MVKTKDISYEEFEEFVERYFLQSVKEMKDYNDEQNQTESVEQYKSTIDEGMMDNISTIVDLSLIHISEPTRRS